MSRLEDATLAKTGKDLNEGKQANLSAGTHVTKGSDGKFSLKPDITNMKFTDDGTLAPNTETGVTSTSTVKALDSTAGIALVNQAKRRKIAISGEADLRTKVKVGDTLYIEELTDSTSDDRLLGLCGQVTSIYSWDNYYQINLTNISGIYSGYYSNKVLLPVISQARVEILWSTNYIEAYFDILGFDTDGSGNRIWSTAREAGAGIKTYSRNCTGYIIRPPMAITNNDEGEDNE